MGKWVKALALAGAGLASMPAGASVILDPVPQPIAVGFTAAIERFVTAPATAPTLPRAMIQSLQPLRDRSGRLFVNDTAGVISVTNVAGAAPAVFFDIRQQDVGFAATNSQTGLVSFAFHPNFNVDPTKPGYRTFYTIDTTAPAGGTPRYSGNGPVSHHDVVREWTVRDPSAATAVIDDTREVLRVAQPRGDHGPGTIAFNPAASEGSADYGKLYIGLGDGGGVNDPNDNAQDLGSPFGKILRIDPADPDGAGTATYSVPSDNPFAGQPGKLGEVWAYGLRNPQQFGWDSVSGALYIADIGQAQLEEVNLGMAGANYGWPLREGTFGRSVDKNVSTVNDDPNPGFYVDPIAQYDHGEGSAIGAAIAYRGTTIAALAGQVVVSDVVNGRLFYFDPTDQAGTMREIALLLDGMATTMRALEGDRGRVDLRLGVDAAGEIYLLTKQDGDIYRLLAVPVPEPSTWATMLLGLMLVGIALRHRPRTGEAALG